MRCAVRLNGKLIMRSYVAEPPKALSTRDFLDALVFDALRNVALRNVEVELTLPFDLVVVADGIAYRLNPTEHGSDWIQALAATS